MTLPITGSLIIILGVWFFLFSPRLLYAAMIISIPFSATAVANVGSGDNEKGVSAWLFLAVLWVVRETISGLPAWRTPGWFATRRARYGLLAFLGAAVASLSVPLLLNGTAWVPEQFLLSNQTVPLRFGMYNLTQTAYLAFGVLLAIFAAAENCGSKRLFYTLKLYVGSCAFAAAWGLFELWCDVSGHAYPAFIFNTNAGESAQGYMEVLDLAEGTLTRISSVALEPSSPCPRTASRVCRPYSWPGSGATAAGKKMGLCGAHFDRDHSARQHIVDCILGYHCSCDSCRSAHGSSGETMEALFDPGRDRRRGRSVGDDGRASGSTDRRHDVTK